MDTNFADWNNADANTVNHDFNFDFASALNLKSSSEDDEDDDPFTSATTANGFNSIIGNNNISNHQQFYHHLSNGAYDQNDFLMNFYVSPLTITNASYPISNTNNHHHPPPSSSSYNPFQYELHDINSNNDNWANFNSDNFADFDSHFANMSVAEAAREAAAENNELEQVKETCFVATTQTVEITTAPPETLIARDFLLGPAIPAPSSVDFRQVLEELEDDEFFSLRDDSNEMSSLTEKMLENTEVPDDEDDDFASADERSVENVRNLENFFVIQEIISSSKGNSEEETNIDQFVDCTVSPSPTDAKNDDNSLNGVDSDETASPPEPNE